MRYLRALRGYLVAVRSLHRSVGVFRICDGDAGTNAGDAGWRLAVGRCRRGLHRIVRAALQHSQCR